MHAAPFAPSLESIMKSPLHVIEADTAVFDALELCKTCGIHHMPLFDGKELLGVVCTCDLEELALDAPVKRALQRPAVVLDVTATIADAMQRMSDEVVGSVLIMRGEHAVGIVTREDVLAASGNETANFRCEVCGARTHLKHHAARGLLCLDCRSRAEPAHLDDGELGGSE